MRILTWLPRDLRDGLARLDTAHDLDPAAAAFDEPADDVPIQPAVAPHRRLLLPALVAAVAVLALGVGFVTLFRTSQSRPAIASEPATRPDPAAVARAWASFPVNAAPRPVVLLGSDVDGPRSGFATGEDKEAFSKGWIRLVVTPSAAPATRDGYQVIPGTAAAAVIATSPNPVSVDVLRITRAQLTDHPFQTDRGTRSLPAWQLHLEGVTDDVFVLAVAPAQRAVVASDPGGRAVARIDASGRHLTIDFLARHTSTGQCDPGFTNSLSVVQTSTAVVLAVTTTPSPIPAGARSPGCTLQLRPVPTVPGESRRKTITLDQPLGGRVVVSGTGGVYEVTRS